MERPSQRTWLQSSIEALRLNRPVGLFLLAWPTLWGLSLAYQGLPPWGTLGIYLSGVVIMRSLGCLWNDYCDKDVDRLVVRAARRPFAMGHLQKRDLLVLSVSLTIPALWLWFQLSRGEQIVAIGAVGCALFYPFAKRKMRNPQMVLGLAFSSPILMAALQSPGWRESNGLGQIWSCSYPFLILFIGHWFWVVAYDTVYALADREGDTLAGVHSAALLYGERAPQRVWFYQLLFLTALATVFFAVPFRWRYGDLLVLAGIAVWWFQQSRVVTARLLDRSLPWEWYTARFRNNNVVGFLITFLFWMR